ncbi:Tetratricopeptide repeat protein 30A [Cladochytrium tenue]|nr:Tetratricopeptide repeat protein 30A [Cladochytrium tenue]
MAGNRTSLPVTGVGIAIPRTAAAAGATGAGIAGAPLSFNQVPEGKYTATVYAYIRDGRYQNVIKLLGNELQAFPKSRAALSLLAYCYYHEQDFQAAAGWYASRILTQSELLTHCSLSFASYEQLVRAYPQVDDYRLYYAQCLFKSGQYQTAEKTCQTIEAPEYAQKVVKLQTAIKYETEDIASCRMLIEQLPQDDVDTIVNQACLLYKECRFEEAVERYSEAIKIAGYQAELSYNLALCYYQLKQYVPALKAIADIIERGIRDHPELSVGMATEGIDVRSVGNTQALHETYLIEAFNLKSAIEYRLKNFEAAREALTDMPPRLEQELDPVTLHNQALTHMDVDPTSGFEKLNFLLQQPPTPPEALGNLLLLYVKYGYTDLAADLMAEHPGVAAGVLEPYLVEFLEATLLRQTAHEEAYKRFDDISSRHVDVLRKLTRRVQEARQNMDEEAVKKVVNEYDDAVEWYIPVLMAQAKIYWDLENYGMVEKIFRKRYRESKYKEAISFYEPIVKKHFDNILEVTAIVLANLCVSYIMTSQNEEAEELMRKIEKEEERVAYEDPTRRTYHLCIVNLVIGTLYCAKGNFEFGISRIMKSMEPFNKKLGPDTWFYAKRCFAALFETLAKHMILLKDSVHADILAFFDACELHGRGVAVSVDPLGPAGAAASAAAAATVGGSTRDSGTADRDSRSARSAAVDPARNNVAYESRLLKSMFLRLSE